MLLAGRITGDRQAIAATLETAVGEIRSAALPDGGTMSLDTATSVTMLDSEQNIVRLDAGRIRISSDEHVQTVRAAQFTISGSGLFDIMATEQGVDVRLLRGRLTVKSPTGALGLSPPQGASGRADGRLARVTASRPRNWPSGLIELDGMTLAEVVAEANRYSKVKIRLSAASAGARRLTGTVRAGDTDGLARAAAAALDLTIRRTPDEIVLRARE